MTSAISKILPFLSRAIPASFALKGLSNINPSISDFVVNSFSAGYAADEVLGFLRNKFEPESEKQERSRLENLQAPLPEEKIALTKKRQGEQIPNLIGTGIGLGAGIAGLAQSNQSQGIPLPGAGQQAQAQPPPSPAPQAVGQQQRQGLPNLPTAQQPPTQPIQMGPVQPGAPIRMGMNTPVAQIAPKLHQFIEHQIMQGHSPVEVGNAAQNISEFKGDVKKVEKKLKADWPTIVNALYGQRYKQMFKPPGQEESQRQNALGKFNKKKSMMDEERERFNGAYPQQSQQPQAQQPNGELHQNLLASLEKLNKALGG
jgi:hypothetical protein